MRPHAPLVPLLRTAPPARFTELLLCAGIDEAEVLHRQRNPVTQTFEYYVHYVECAQPAYSFGLTMNAAPSEPMCNC